MARTISFIREHYSVSIPLSDDVEKAGVILKEGATFASAPRKPVLPAIKNAKAVVGSLDFSGWMKLLG